MTLRTKGEQKSDLDELESCHNDCEHCTWTEFPIEEVAVSRPTVVKFEGTNMACMGGDEIMKEFENNPQQNDDALSRKSLKHKLQERHDFFVNAYGGFSNLPQNDKSRVDEITNCIAMVVNEPPVIPQQKSIECDDEVSREACLMCLTGEFVPGKEYKPEELIAVFSKRIRALPPVTVRQTGEWIIKEDNTSYVKTLPRRWAECSKCQWSMSPGYVGQYAFCPNCGVRMRGDVKPEWCPIVGDMDAIRAEIAEDMQNADNEAKKIQDDIDCGIAIGLKMALDTIDKYTKGAEE